MNLVFMELKAYRKSLIIWSICMVLGVYSGMVKYPTYSSDHAANDVLQQLPRTMRALFGMGSLNVSVMSGFFAFLFSYIVLAAAIHAGLLGSGIIAKEERDKTTEFLLVKPVSRTLVITAKLMAAILQLVVLNALTLAASLLFVAAYNKGKDISVEIALLFATMLIIQLIFLSLGAFLAARMQRSKTSGAVTAALLFGAYILGKITDLTHHLNVLNLLSPFKYFSTGAIVAKQELSFTAVLLSLLLAAILVAGAYYFYKKRDMNY